MSRINVDSKALTDSRFAELARRLGLADADHAIGRMVRVWNEATERGVTALPAHAIDCHLGPGGAGALIASELATQLVGGLVRLRGGKGRLTWLRDARSSSVKGGKKRASGAVRIGGRFTSSHQPAPGENPPAVTSALAPDIAPALAPAPDPDPSQLAIRRSRAVVSPGHEDPESESFGFFGDRAPPADYDQRRERYDGPGRPPEPSTHQAQVNGATYAQEYRAAQSDLPRRHGAMSAQESVQALAESVRVLGYRPK